MGNRYNRDPYNDSAYDPNRSMEYDPNRSRDENDRRDYKGVPTGKIASFLGLAPWD